MASDKPKSDMVAEQIAKVRNIYLARMPEELDALQLLALTLIGAESDRISLDTLHHRLHKLAGSGGTFGLARLSAQARILENLMKGWLTGSMTDVNVNARHDFLIALGKLPDTLSEESHPASSLLPSKSKQEINQTRTIWLVEDDIQLGNELSRQLESLNYVVRLFTEIADAESAAQHEQPHMLIMGVMFDERVGNSTQVLKMCPNLKKLPCPLIFVSALDDLQTRIRAVQLGAVGYFLKPLDVPRLVGRMMEIFNRPPAPPERVLIVDDDVELAEHYRLVLLDAGMEAEVLHQPELIIENILAFRPELILMDMHMPGYSGADLAGVIRQYDKFGGLPIVYLSAEVDLDKQIAAMGRGADDFLTKPISDAKLSAAVYVRIERARHLNSASQALATQFLALQNSESEQQRISALLRKSVQEMAAIQFALEQASQRELEIGNRIQQTLLVAPPSQEYAGLWMSAFNQSSKGIDGDFFDVIRVGTDAVDIIVGDVMGKGVPAALLGAATKLQFSRSMAELLVERNPLDGPPQPKDIVGLVNRVMAPHLQALDAFVTFVYLRIDVKANTVTWVGCGHEESLLIDSRGNAQLLGNQHTPIGLFLDEQYEQDVCALGADDAIFLCSDGASDAILEGGGRLGRDIINATIIRHMLAHRTPAMALHALRRDLLLDQVKLTDDLTMVMLTRNDLGRNIARLEAPVSLQSLKAVREFVAAQTAILSEEVAGLLTVAAVEVMTNVIRHAQDLVPSAPVELLIEQSPAGLQLDFKYLGQRFEPTADAPEIDFDNFPEGGFGLHIIQGASDQVDYLYQDGVNTVRMLVRSA